MFYSVNIGFQGEDPATDFRGSGILGLLNLHSFVNNFKAEAKEVYENSLQIDSQYFFASAGLYISLKICEWIKVFILINQNGLFDSIFYDHNCNEDTLAMVNKLYASIFKDFDIFWMNQLVRSLMMFNETIVQ